MEQTTVALLYGALVGAGIGAVLQDVFHSRRFSCRRWPPCLPQDHVSEIVDVVSREAGGRERMKRKYRVSDEQLYDLMVDKGYGWCIECEEFQKYGDFVGEDGGRVDTCRLCRSRVYVGTEGEGR